MKIDKLEKELDKSINIFIEQAHLRIRDIGDDHLDGNDYNEIARQTCYVFGDFKDSIIKYLKSQEK